jgi:dipeptidase D
LIVGTSQRSSIESAKRNIARSVQAVFELAGAKVKMSDGYPGWQPNIESPLLQLATDLYKKTYGKEPAVKAVHAGLECGILSDKYPGLDMISFGPTIIGAHSPDEKVNINAVIKFYSFLKILLHELTK